MKTEKERKQMAANIVYDRYGSHEVDGLYDELERKFSPYFERRGGGEVDAEEAADWDAIKAAIAERENEGVYHGA
jgi:hypothetical protein